MWLNGVASAAPVYWPPEGGRLTPQVQLFQLLVFVFLILDIFPDDCFISTYGRDETSACPEALTHKPALPLAIDTGKVDRALAFDIPDHLTNTKSLKVRPMGPSPRSDRHDEPRAFNQLVPIETAMIEDVFIGGEDPVGEPIIAHVLPDVLDGVELG